MILALALALLPCPPTTSAVLQDEPLSGEAGFHESVQAAQTAMQRRRWKDAQALLLALLETHAGADYVRPQLQSLKEDLRRAAFWKDVAEPDAEDLVQGELLTYSPRTGRVKLRLTRRDLGDFAKEGAAYVHPMHFAGPWSIELEGSSDQVASAAYFVMLAPNDGYMLRFGAREKGDFVFTQHVATRVRGVKTENLAVVEPPERSAKKPTAKAKIEVRKQSIRASYDRKRVIQVDKPEEGFGSLVLVGDGADGISADFGTITVEGIIDGGWIGGLVDEAVSDQRAAFDASWTDPALFDAWALEESVEVEDVTWVELIGRLKFTFLLTPEHQASFEKISALLGKGPGQAAQLLEVLEQAPAESLPPAGFAYVRLHCAMELRRPALALANLDGLSVGEGQELDLALLRALLLRAAGRLDDERALLNEVLAQHPTSSLAHAQLTDALLLSRDPEKAQEAILAGRALLPGSARLRQLEAQVVKAAKGPAWHRVLEEEGDHFILRFDGERKLAKRAVAVLDEAWERCEDYFGPLPSAPAEPSRAYLFSGQSSYLTYVNGIADSSPENTLGVYSPRLQQIAAWNQPNSQELFDTLRHECAHRYLDLQLGYRIPRWLNEGLAETFAGAFAADGTWKPGGDRDHQLAVFGASFKLYPVETFMRATEESFLAEPMESYAQAWALVHFLRFGKEADRALLERLIAALAQGDSEQVAVDAALEGVDVEQLQGRFLEWLKRTISDHRRGR